MKNYKEMTDDQLFEEYMRLGRNQMYYMAAEGNWSSEAKERGETNAEYYACSAECAKRGLESL